MFILAAQHHNLNKLQSYSFPSNKDINLTLGASGTSYVAPADGYYYLCKESTQAGQYIQLDGTFTIMSSAVWASQWCYVYMFAREGQTITVSYNNGGNTIAFKFIYAVGSAPA